MVPRPHAFEKKYTHPPPHPEFLDPPLVRRRNFKLYLLLGEKKENLLKNSVTDFFFLEILKLYREEIKLICVKYASIVQWGFHSQIGFTSDSLMFFSFHVLNKRCGNRTKAGFFQCYNTRHSCTWDKWLKKVIR